MNTREARIRVRFPIGDVFLLHVKPYYMLSLTDLSSDGVYTFDEHCYIVQSLASPQILTLRFATYT